MGIGQASVEALSISLISDLVGWRNVFIGESILYVGVYIGEAISGQIATAFTRTDKSWRIALRAIGITGCVVSVLLRLILREPERRHSLVQTPTNYQHDSTADFHNVSQRHPNISRFGAAKLDFVASFSYRVAVSLRHHCWCSRVGGSVEWRIAHLDSLAAHEVDTSLSYRNWRNGQ